MQHPRASAIEPTAPLPENSIAVHDDDSKVKASKPQEIWSRRKVLCSCGRTFSLDSSACLPTRNSRAKGHGLARLRPKSWLDPALSQNRRRPGYLGEPLGRHRGRYGCQRNWRERRFGNSERTSSLKRRTTSLQTKRWNAMRSTAHLSRPVCSRGHWRQSVQRYQCRLRRRSYSQRDRLVQSPGGYELPFAFFRLQPCGTSPLITQSSSHPNQDITS